MELYFCEFYLSRLYKWSVLCVCICVASLAQCCLEDSSMELRRAIHSFPMLRRFLLYQGLANYGPRPHPASGRFCMAQELRMLFIFIKLWKKSTTKPKLWDRDLQSLKYLPSGPSWEKFSGLAFFECTVIYFSVTFLMGIWMVCRFLASENAAMNILVRIFMCTYACVFLGNVTGNKNIRIVKFSRSPQYSKLVVPLIFPTAVYENPTCSISSTTLNHINS